MQRRQCHTYMAEGNVSSEYLTRWQVCQVVVRGHPYDVYVEPLNCCLQPLPVHKLGVVVAAS